MVGRVRPDALESGSVGRLDEHDSVGWHAVITITASSPAYHRVQNVLRSWPDAPHSALRLMYRCKAWSDDQVVNLVPRTHGFTARYTEAVNAQLNLRHQVDLGPL